MSKKNKLISIGYIGMRRSYLNVSMEEAKNRYCKLNNLSLEELDDDNDISIFETNFDDEFGSYEIWEDED